MAPPHGFRRSKGTASGDLVCTIVHGLVLLDLWLVRKSDTIVTVGIDYFRWLWNWCNIY